MQILKLVPIDSISQSFSFFAATTLIRLWTKFRERETGPAKNFPKLHNTPNIPRVGAEPFSGWQENWTIDQREMNEEREREWDGVCGGSTENVG